MSYVGVMSCVECVYMSCVDSYVVRWCVCRALVRMSGVDEYVFRYIYSRFECFESIVLIKRSIALYIYQSLPYLAQ